MKGNKQVILIILGVFISIIAVFWYVAAPIYNDTVALSKSIESKKADFDKKKQLVLDVSALKKSYSEIEQSSKDKLIRVLPKEENIINFLPELEVMLTQNGLNIESISLENLTGETSGQKAPGFIKKDVVPLRVSVKTKGSYESFRNFLTSIEWNERLSDIASIDLKLDKKETAKEGAETEAQKFSFNIILYAYWMK